MKTKILLLGLVFLTVPALVSAASHTAGTNVLSNGTVFMVTTDSQLRPYTSSGAFLSYGFNTWSGVAPANSDDLNLPTGSFIPPRDGGITCSDRGADKGTCYLITDGKKAGFTSADVFSKLGFNFNRALSGDVSFLPSTSNITTATDAHLPGTLINDNGTVKLIGSSGAVGVPSVDTLKSWGYSLDDVVPANTRDKTIPQTEVLAPHSSGQLAWREPLVPTPKPNPIPCADTITTPNCEPVYPPNPIPCSVINLSTRCIEPMPEPTPTPNHSAVTIAALTPSFGPVGTVVTVSGSGFTPTNNYVLFGLGSLPNYSSTNDGKTLQFTVPTSQAAYCAPGVACALYMQQVTSGFYNVRIANANGMSDAMGFTVTSTTPIPCTNSISCITPPPTLTPTPTPVPPTTTSNILVGTVRENATIDLKKADALVTSLQPGTYTIYVADQTFMHNFHLMGPGVDMKTTVDGVANTSWNVNLTAGAYTYVCDPHSANMRGTFIVAN